mmetsp:Transcript_28665/g.52828  ORF Transcript_28665/g.52828 Transcript_28665/m.52828 type:complete len:203 (+) Transcript_28665:208-816(+)
MQEFCSATIWPSAPAVCAAARPWSCVLAKGRGRLEPAVTRRNGAVPQPWTAIGWPAGSLPPVGATNAAAFLQSHSQHWGPQDVAKAHWPSRTRRAEWHHAAEYWPHGLCGEGLAARQHAEAVPQPGSDRSQSRRRQAAVGTRNPFQGRGILHSAPRDSGSASAPQGHKLGALPRVRNALPRKHVVAAVRPSEAAPTVPQRLF